MFRREFAFYCFGASLFLSASMVAGALLWMLTPPQEKFDLGAVEEFSAGQPVARYVERRDSTTLPLWVVRTEDKWLVFDRRVQIGRYWHCQYAWVAVNNRFEDPCSGFKWALTGILLSYPFSFIHEGDYPLFLHDLDQYPTTIEQGHLVINADKPVHGLVRTEKPEGIICPIEHSCFLPTLPSEP
jgi:hypothetical protein